jgi:CheY-like chemotaxis protein
MRGCGGASSAQALKGVAGARGYYWAASMDGWELLRALRADPVLTRIPVVIMTAEENSRPVIP